MNVKSSLPLAAAEKIVDAALAAGVRHQMMPLTVVVLDSGGHTVAMKRQDGCGNMRAGVATGKAWGALGMGLPSRLIRDRLADRPAFQGALSAVSEGRFVPVPGGVLICDAEGYAVGAVGISGDTSDKDEFCGIEGVKAAGLTPDPAEPAADWASSRL
jgi:uncharacterized protein GlcG (DUF336 family)